MKSIFEQLETSLLIKSKNLSVLTHILKDDLPAQSHLHFHVVKLNQDTLFIVTDSPVWATKLRQLAPKLIESLHQKRHNRLYNINLEALIPASLRHIRVSTRPGQIITAAGPRHVQPLLHLRSLSIQTGILLTQTADCINDEQLSKALRRLSRHSRENRSA